MLIYHKDGWYEYRSLTEGNCFCNTFSSAKKEILKRFEVDLYQFLN